MATFGFNYIKSANGYTLFQVGHYSYEIVQKPDFKRVQAFTTNCENAIQYFDRFTANH